MIFYENTMEDIANSLNLTKDYFEYVYFGIEDSRRLELNNEKFKKFCNRKLYNAKINM